MNLEKYYQLKCTEAIQLTFHISLHLEELQGLKLDLWICYILTLESQTKLINLNLNLLCWSSLVYAHSTNLKMLIKARTKPEVPHSVEIKPYRCLGGNREDIFCCSIVLYHLIWAVQYMNPWDSLDLVSQFFLCQIYETEDVSKRLKSYKEIHKSVLKRAKIDFSMSCQQSLAVPAMEDFVLCVLGWNFLPLPLLAPRSSGAGGRRRAVGGLWVTLVFYNCWWGVHRHPIGCYWGDCCGVLCAYQHDWHMIRRIYRLL